MTWNEWAGSCQPWRRTIGTVPGMACGSGTPTRGYQHSHNSLPRLSGSLPTVAIIVVILFAWKSLQLRTYLAKSGSVLTPSHLCRIWRWKTACESCGMLGKRLPDRIESRDNMKFGLEVNTGAKSALRTNANEEGQVNKHPRLPFLKPRQILG